MGLISIIDSLQCFIGSQVPRASMTMRHLHGQEVLKEIFDQGMEIAGALGAWARAKKSWRHLMYAWNAVLSRLQNPNSMSQPPSKETFSLTRKSMSPHPA